jgi:hypothetical protein
MDSINNVELNVRRCWYEMKIDLKILRIHRLADTRATFKAENSKKKKKRQHMAMAV